mmetsp:Transcript_6830/g.9381  ORF Transcript_6830/g.9381 Transcript_6830/m.9381 type:complete len:2025 (+) Transcript_6830:44-6118(+)
MSSNKFYPSLLNILPTENIPSSLGPVKDGIESLFENLFYRNLQTDKSSSGDSGFYRLDLIAYKRIGFEIPGTGLALVANPDDSGLNVTPISISLGYELQILKHIKNFNISSFSEAPEAFFQLFLDLTDLSTEEILEEAIAVFFDSQDPLNAFITRFNQVQNTSIDLNAPPTLTNVQYLVEQIEGLQIDTFQYILEDLIQSVNSFEEIIQNIKDLFRKWLGEIDLDDVKRLLIPQASLSLNDLKVGIVFPTSILKQVDDQIVPPNTVPTYEPLTNNGEFVPSVLALTVGSLSYTTQDGIQFDDNFTFESFPTSEILNTGFCIGFSGVKLDLSRTTNIAQATADGRPLDFVGAYIEEANIVFPMFWNHDSPGSTGVLKGRNLLVGTGGISGNLSMEAVNSGNPDPIIKAKFGEGFEVSLSSFALEFQQNAILSSEIKGIMKVPAFKDANGDEAELEIDVHIGQEGDFSVTVTEADGFELEIPNAIRLLVKSASVGREDDRFYLSVSGELTVTNNTVNSFLGAPIEFQEIIIWDDGQYEIKGGGLELPKAIGFDAGPVKMAITSIHLGSDTRDFTDEFSVLHPNEGYKFIGFDGTLKVDPGGIDAKGEGVKFYYADNIINNKRHCFLRIDSLKIDLVFPGDASKETAAALIYGFLSIKDAPSGYPGSEYAGGVDISLPKVGASGAVRMRFNPKVPYFIIDAEIEPKKAIPIANTGTGIYGFRGLVGKHFVASKEEAGVNPQDPWWEYYKAKVPNAYREGVQIGKFAPTGGFSVGFGVSLATTMDGGKVFSSKIFLLLSLRELLMLQGQAAILKERIKLNDPNDPPFFALLVISKESIEAALGVNYLIPDDKSTPGSIATVQGVLELGFFFKDSSAWYVNVGRDLPESYRILVRALSLFDCYFYFMLNNRGIRTGAGASFEVDEEWGPLSAYLYAYLDIAAKVAFKPKQFGGSIQLGGGIDISIFGLGFGISAAAGLAAEAPEPFNVSGFVEACIKVMGKEWCAQFEFSWEFNPTIPATAIGVANAGAQGIASMVQAVNIQTKEIFALTYATSSVSVSNPPAWNSASWNGAFEDHIIPLDCFIDLDFTNGMNPIGNLSTENFGILGGGANHIKKVAPQKGKSPQVFHNFHVQDIKVFAWDDNGAGSWVDYDIYAAMTEWADPQGSLQAAYSALDLKQGYWQTEAPNTYNKLRILAQNPLSFTTQTSGSYVPENSGVTSEYIFCDAEEIPKTCLNFSDYIPIRKGEATDWTEDFTLTGLPVAGNVSSIQMYNNAYPTQSLGTVYGNQLYVFGEVSFALKTSGGGIVTAPQTLGANSIGLGMEQNTALEITFNEPMVCIDYGLTTFTNEIVVEFYRTIIDPNASGNNVIDQLISSVTHTESTVNGAVQQYMDAANPVDKMIIKSGENPEGESFGPYCEPELTLEGEHLEAFFDTLIQNGDLMNISFQMNDVTHDPIYNTIFMNSPLYQWQGVGSAPDLNYSLVITGNYLTITISDGVDFNCVYKLEPGGRFDWATVTGFTNLRKDPNHSSAGANYSFIIDAELSGGGTATMPGSTTCHNILNCYNDLTTWMLTLCHLSVEDYAFNQTVLSSTQNTAQLNSMAQAMQQTIQPIWKPNTRYAIAVHVRETVSGGASATHDHVYNFGFSTAGPVGHFHKYQDNFGAGLETLRSDYQELLSIDQEESYVLSTLKPYVNYEKSYPNANGELLNAKPLFYEDPNLLLFFNKDYVYHMFEGWANYNSQESINGSMLVDIEDPVTPTIPIATTVRWQRDFAPQQGSDSQMLNNMMTNASQGGCEPSPYIQHGVVAEIEVNNLKPLKLYSAVIKNSFGWNGSSPVVRDVLKYPFKTSRYPNFAAQIQSYILAEDNGTPLKTAIYDVVSTADSNAITEAVSMQAPVSTIKIANFADKIERILQGALSLGTLPPAISTEFNFIKSGTRILGVLIRCQEPFNDPKIPESVTSDTVSLAIDSGGAFNVYHAKDLREVFITNAAMDLAGGEYEFTFRYRQWDRAANSFTDQAVETVTHNVPSSI